MSSLPTDVPGSSPAEPHFVSASELVRQFGVWQDRAARAPVYVHHRGRPRLVLTSVAIMEALCGRPEGADQHGVELSVLLDAIRELAVVVDGGGQLLLVNRAARRYFAVEQVLGLPLQHLFAGASGAFVGQIVRRVLASGTSEAIEIESPRYAGRRLAIEAVPHPSGVLLLGLDVSDREDARDAHALIAAVDGALDQLPGVAMARINARGYVEGHALSLARLIGVAAEALGSVRFVTLMELASRVVGGEAFDGVMADGVARMCEVRLLANRSDPIAVRMALSAIRRDATVEGVVALLSAEPPHGFAGLNRR